MSRTTSQVQSHFQAQAQTASQKTEARRLTLTSNSKYTPLKTNIPQFTRLPPPSPNLKPLPKPSKPIKPIKPIKTPQEKKQEKRAGYLRKVEKARALRLEKERGPLPEPEEGGYDEFGFWVEHEKKIVEETVSQDDREGSGVQLRLRGGGGDDEGREDSSSGMELDHGIAMREVLNDLQAMPSEQSFSGLFEIGERLHPPPDTHNQVPAASTAPRDQQKRKRQEDPQALNDLASTSSRSSERPSHPMLDQRTRTRYPTSAMRGNAEDDDDQHLNQMPVSAQPRRESIYQTEYDSQEDMVRLSPTEVNSSAFQEPVSRSQTRRSNDRSRVYSLQPPASVITPNASPIPPPSFAISDTQPDSPDSLDSPDSPRYKSAPGPSRVKTYAKGSKSAPTRRNTTISRNPAQRKEFKDFFSPEPEWEQEHLTGVSASNRSKRAGSTSWWPQPDTPALVDDQEGESHEDEDEEEEEMGGGLRHILGELEVNEKGHRIVRGRRNGPWPSERLKGLFDDDSQDDHRPIELYRPVSDRLHLVQVKEEPQDTLVQDTSPLPDEIKIARKKKHNNRANYDRPIVHPAPLLNMRREQSVIGRLDDYTLKVNSRQSKHQAHLHNNPVVHTNIKSRIKPLKKRRSRFEIPNLPPSVLKPITTIPADEYRRQLKSRNPGDGFLNPVLIKAGRLGTRDAIIQQHQVRIRSTGRRGVKTQTPIVDDHGDPDPIEVILTQVPRDEQPGFAVRQLERVKATTARYQKLRPKLPFTSQSPPLPSSDNNHGGVHAMQFTTRSPPRPQRHHTNLDLELDDDVENEPTARPAVNVPGVVAPQVGLGTRYKKKVDFNTSTIETSSTAHNGQGFIRRRPGFLWEPSSGEARGEPIYHNDNDIEREVPEPLCTLPMGRSQYRNQDDEEEEPLFLSHEEVEKDLDMMFNMDDDRDLESNASRHDPASNANPEANPESRINDEPTDMGLSGAQLCNNLLKSVARLPIPFKRISKSRREEKREEMARRINERDSKEPRPEGGRLADKIQGYGPLFDELELDEEEVSLQPTSSQLKRRAEFGFKVSSGEEAMMNTQVGEEELDFGSNLPATQVQLTTQLSSFQPDIGPPARNPGRSDPTPSSVAATATGTGTANATAGPSGIITAPTKLKKTTSKFFPPKAIQKPTDGGKVTRSKTRLGPKWATEEEIA